MIRFYSNREVAGKFDVKLARWKRWSREFLPPDPLGGMQSGYARQYHPDQVFTVFLGGYLVADLKFTIPEARQILHDLAGWLSDHGFCFAARNRKESAADSSGRILEYRIFILRKKPAGPGDGSLDYRIQGMLERFQASDTDPPVVTEKFFQIVPQHPQRNFPQMESAVMVNITRLLRRVVSTIGQDAANYPALQPGTGARGRN